MAKGSQMSGSSGQVPDGQGTSMWQNGLPLIVIVKYNVDCSPLDFGA